MAIKDYFVEGHTVKICRWQLEELLAKMKDGNMIEADIHIMDGEEFLTDGILFDNVMTPHEKIENEKKGLTNIK